MVKKKVKKTAVCPAESCGGCKAGSWLLPLVIVLLVWFGPVVLWSKVVVTIAAVFMAAREYCPSRDK